MTAVRRPAALPAASHATCDVGQGCAPVVLSAGLSPSAPAPALLAHRILAPQHFVLVRARPLASAGRAEAPSHHEAAVPWPLGMPVCEAWDNVELMETPVCAAAVAFTYGAPPFTYSATATRRRALCACPWQPAAGQSRAAAAIPPWSSVGACALHGTSGSWSGKLGDEKWVCSPRRRRATARGRGRGRGSRHARAGRQQHSCASYKGRPSCPSQLTGSWPARQSRPLPCPAHTECPHAYPYRYGILYSSLPSSIFSPGEPVLICQAGPPAAPAHTAQVSPARPPLSRAASPPSHIPVMSAPAILVKSWLCS